MSIDCPLCKNNKTLIYKKSKDVEYFSSKKLYSYFFCTLCEIIFLLNPPNQISKIYPKSYYSFSKNDKNLYKFFNLIKNYLDLRLFKNILKKLKKREIHCLDVGGGSGWISKNLILADNRVKKVTVVDIVTPRKKVINYDDKINFVKSKIENFKTKKKYDFILLLNLIEHVPNPDVILNKIRNLLSSEGVCLIKTPNFKSMNNFLFKDLYWGGLHCPRHFIIFNLKSFLLLCKKTKLKIIHYKFTQGLPQWHASIIGSLREKKFLKKRIPIHKHISWVIIFPFAIIIDFFLLKWLHRSDQVFYLLKK
jgi:2-polyprenyl-3-methyl-5-hydroxy-6-metoxy-1,4-benzoquinol methylase